MALILIILLALLMCGGLPVWGYHPYGYYPSGGLGFVLVILLVLVLFGLL